MVASPQLSIIIPAYNEERRLPSTLARVFSYLAQRGILAELIVVDDGSRDGTAELVRRSRTHAPAGVQLRLLNNPGNRGKGYSVRHGMLEARGERLLFTDADLSAPIEEVEKLEASLDAGAAVAIGSRSRQELIRAHQSRLRETAGRTFNKIVKLVLRLPFHDTQCGFKLFRRDAAEAIFPCQMIERWGFDPELLYLARHFRFQVEEIPVVWAHVEGAKIRMLRDSARMFVDVIEIRWNALLGRYRRRRSRSAAA